MLAKLNKGNTGAYRDSSVWPTAYEKPKDLSPALLSRPTSKGRRLSAKRRLPEKFENSSEDLTPAKEGVKHSRSGSFGGKKLKEGEPDELALENMEYVFPSSPLPMFGNSDLNDNFCDFIKKKLRIWCQLQNGERKSGQIQSLSTETTNVLLANGSGGNNHVIEHYKETGYPLAFKLGTITSDLEGADVFCYPEDESVLDPHLAQHLDFFGVDFSSLHKTEMTTAERELDQNTNFDWNRIQESGQEVEPLWIFDLGGDTFDPGGDTFDPGERNILATSASDRSIALYDLRMSSPAKKLIMRTRTNSIAWNPREPMNFTTANEDSNCYSYDARKLNAAKCVHKDHVSAVMDIDYSPTGREFVTGSYDRTLRIFQYNSGHNREIYHTKRLQRVFCVKFSGDASYVISGSDDTNLRLWKARASEQMGVLLPREHRQHEYQDAVKKPYKHLLEVKRQIGHRAKFPVSYP